MVNRTDVLANPEVTKAVTEMQNLLREVVRQATFAGREEAALAIGNAVVRGFLEQDLQGLSDSLGGDVWVDGVAYKEHESGAATYHSLCGPLEVRRPSSRAIGVHNGPIVIALEVAAGLVERATPAMAYNVMHGYAQHDMRIHGETLESAHRLPPSRTTLERIAKRLAEKAIEQSSRIEPLIRRAEKVPAEAVAVSIGLDRTSAPMIEDRPEDAPPKPEPKRRRPRVRSAPAPYDINWRMAYVGTVCFVDEYGNAVHTIRYAAAACDDPRELVGRMTLDLAAALKKRPNLPMGIVQDGAPEMWNRTREGMQQLRDEGVLQDWHEGIDRYHLMERLGEALKIVVPEDTAEQRDVMLEYWNKSLDTHRDAIDWIEQFLRVGLQNVCEAQQKTLREHIVYIENNKDRMRYVDLRDDGLPIGSGVTESAAKTVINQRAKRAGQRWREDGLRGAITLRSLHQSDRLPRFWSHLQRTYAANVQARQVA